MVTAFEMMLFVDSGIDIFSHTQLHGAELRKTLMTVQHQSMSTIHKVFCFRNSNTEWPGRDM